MLIIKYVAKGLFVLINEKSHWSTRMIFKQKAGGIFSWLNFEQSVGG